MTQEQKAKAYDKALERAKKYLGDCMLTRQEYVEKVFPELKESKDEKIRKVIRGWIYTRPASFFDNGISKEEILAWLERQGEHLENFDEAEKEKSDFVGDGFIKCFANFLDFKEGNTYWLEYMGDDKYNVRSDNLLGKTYHITPCQLYTVFKKLTWLEKQGEQKPADKVKPKFHEGDWVVYEENIYQIHNISLKKYYECLRTDGTVHIFDFEYIDSKSHLWTIQDAKDGDVLVKNMYPTGPDICIFKEFIRQTFTMKVYCSINNKGQFLHNHDAYYHRYDVSLYPATKEQRDALMKAMSDAGWEFDFNKKELKKIESKNIEGTFINVDEVRENFVKEVYRVLADDTTNDRANDIIYYFDSLPTIYLHTNKPLPSDYDDFDIFKNHAWSEEDEKIYQSIIDDTVQENQLDDKQINWLKSIRLHSHWKPSKEQMLALNIAIEMEDGDILKSLYNDLKQL